LVNKPVLKVYTKTDLYTKINIPEKEDTLKISSMTKD
jgi:hypothetical protein